MKGKLFLMLRLVAVFALVAGLGMVMAPEAKAAPAEKVINWTFAITFPAPGTPWHDIGSKEFGARIEKATNGRIKVKHLPVGVINGLDGMTAIRDGRIQACNFNYGFLDATYPMTNILTLVHARNERDLMPLYDKVVWPIAAKTFEPLYGVKLVAQGCWPGHTYYTRKPLKTVADFKGLKARTDSNYAAMTLKALGGAPVAMPFGELYVAIERGMVDAFISAHGSVLGSKMYDVAKYIDEWPLGVATWGVFISQKALDALPKDVRTAVDAEMAKLRTELVPRCYDVIDRDLEVLKKHGMTVVKPSDEEAEKFKKIVRDNTIQEFYKQTGNEGREWLKKCYEIIGVKQQH